jgi:hypothetical protein
MALENPREYNICQNYKYFFSFNFNIKGTVARDFLALVFFMELLYMGP